ncbi:MAG: hypothetical protein ACTSRP_06535 [Candidatus Helarchaeota archaeon]
MALNWKTRTLVVFLVLMAALISVIYNQILIKLPTEVNEEDPLFFEKNRYASYYYNNGSIDQLQDVVLIINADVINSTHTNVSIYINSKLHGSFLVNPEGYVYENGTLKKNYSIWWVHVENPMLEIFTGFGVEAGKRFNLIDPTGFLGAPWQNYTAVVDRKRVWWPEDQKLGKILGAQASFQMFIYGPGGNKVATATLDLTCGLVELWDGGINSRQTMTLYDTNYPISRNRLVIFPVLWIAGTILIVVAYVVMRIDWKNKLLHRLHLNSEKRNEATLLMIAGVMAIGIEYIDIWFYAPLGKDGNLYLHLGYFGFLVLLCFVLKKRLVWTIPAFLEIAFVFAITYAVNDPYVPHLTAFMGSTISWLCLVWISKHDNDWIEGKTWIGKILSKLS